MLGKTRAIESGRKKTLGELQQPPWLHKGEKKSKSKEKL